MRFGEAPAPAYPEYDELHRLAEARCPRFVDPSTLDVPDEIARRRGWDWATAVLGRVWPGGRWITPVETELVKLADERDIDPPLPGHIIEGRRLAEERAAMLRQKREETARRDVDRWRAALDGAAEGIEFQVFTNTVARARYGSKHNLGHVVPKADVYSGVRKVRTHPAGRALCETEHRNPLRLHSTPEPDDVPGTCVRCLQWVPTVRTKP